MRHRGKFYRKSLIWTLIVSSIPGIVIGAFMYWVAEGRIKSELHKLHNHQVVTRAKHMDEQLSHIELTITNWPLDPKFNSTLLQRDFSVQFKEARDLTKTLTILRESLPLAQRVELYIMSGPSPVLFDTEYNNLSDPSMIHNYNRYITQGKSVYWTSGGQSPGGNQNTPHLSLVHKIPSGSVNPVGAVLLHLNHAKVIELMKTLTPYDRGEALLMESDGRILASTRNLSAPIDQALQEQVQLRLRQAQAGSFFFDWEDGSYTVSYGQFARLGTTWTYASAAPVYAIMAPIVFLSKLILLMSFVLLFTALLLSWIASRSIYSPVDRLLRYFASDKQLPPEAGCYDDEFLFLEKQWHHLMKESRTLQNKVKHQLPHIREGFLLQLIQGYLHAFSEQDLRDRMTQYGWEVHDSRFVVLYIQLTGFDRLSSTRFSKGDKGLVTFAAANMIEELASVRFKQASVINFHDLTVGLVLILPDGEEVSELSSLSEEIVESIHRLLHIQLTVTISRSTDAIVQIPYLFEEAKYALGYRNFENANQIIPLEELRMNEEANSLRYPLVLEREILQAIRAGLQQDSIRLIEAFMNVLRDSGAKEMDIQQAMLQLLGSIQQAMIHAGIPLTRLTKGVNLFERLSQIREPEQMMEWFEQMVVGPCLDELGVRQEQHTTKMIESVLLYMNEHYREDISLDVCAEHAKTTPNFLSKSFKKVTGNNFLEHLTQLRMNKAKELLRDSELRINEVAETVGYQHTYFNRLFKKQEGITPSQYREQCLDTGKRLPHVSEGGELSS